MWTPTTREQHSRKALRYQTDLTDAEWVVIEPHLPPAHGMGRPPGARDLRQKIGVIGVRLVVLKLHHRMGLAGVDQHHGHAKLIPTAQNSDSQGIPFLGWM